MNLVVKITGLTARVQQSQTKYFLKLKKDGGGGLVTGEVTRSAEDSKTWYFTEERETK